MSQAKDKKKKHKNQQHDAVTVKLRHTIEMASIQTKEGINVFLAFEIFDFAFDTWNKYTMFAFAALFYSFFFLNAHVDLNCIHIFFLFYFLSITVTLAHTQHTS